MIIKGKNCDYKVVMGLETHAELNTNTKLFSQSANKFGCDQNENVCLFDIATPGKLPVLNRGVIDKAVAFGLAIDATINKISIFDRKHYFYPDLPQGYQITQFYHPIVTNGKLEITLENGEKKTIRINRAHIEQDAGKLIHDRSEDNSYIDYNRSGVPLIEIVTEPDFNDPEEVVVYLKSLQAILRTINASLADLEKGTFRCDANVSVMPVGSSEFGTRCEIKNLNSFRFVAQAVEYEAKRQVELIENGEKVNQQTRLFNSKTGVTELMRDKADAVDYRYFPEPDLLPIILTDEEITNIKNNLPELPNKKAERYEKLGLSKKENDFLVQNANYARYFDKLIEKCDVKLSKTWFLNELIGRLNKNNVLIENCKVSVENMIDLITNISNQNISGKIAKDVLDIMLETGELASNIIEKNNWKMINDIDVITKIIKEVIAENQDLVDQYKAGKTKVIGNIISKILQKNSNVNVGLLQELIINNLV